MAKQRSSVFEAIDACRPDSDDLELPELQTLARRMACDEAARQIYERSQQFDKLVCQAFHGLPVPSGLMAKLLKAIEREGETTELPSREMVEVNSVISQRSAAIAAGRVTSNSFKVLPRWGRRRSLAAFATSVICLSLVVFVALHAVHLMSDRAPLSVERLVDELRLSYDAIQQGPWNVNLTSSPLEQHGIISLLLASPRQWRIATVRHGTQAVVYDLSPQEGQPLAVLLVIKTTRRFGAPEMFPFEPHSTTGRLCIGVCQRDSHVYVLVVQGDVERYQQFIKADTPVV